MLWARQVLSACLALALAGFSVAAAAPGHAHAAGASHHDILHAIAVDAHGDSHHADSDHADSHGADSAQEQQMAEHEGDQSGGDDDQTESAPAFHSHAFVSYTAAESRLSLDRPSTVTSAIWSELPCPSMTGSCTLLLRPPRFFL